MRQWTQHNLCTHHLRYYTGVFRFNWLWNVLLFYEILSYHVWNVLSLAQISKVIVLMCIAVLISIVNEGFTIKKQTDRIVVVLQWFHSQMLYLVSFKVVIFLYIYYSCGKQCISTRSNLNALKTAVWYLLLFAESLTNEVELCHWLTKNVIAYHQCVVRYVRTLGKTLCYSFNTPFTIQVLGTRQLKAIIHKCLKSF